jgi:hypothetical protein
MSTWRSLFRCGYRSGRGAGALGELVGAFLGSWASSGADLIESGSPGVSAWHASSSRVVLIMYNRYL